MYRFPFSSLDLMFAKYFLICLCTAFKNVKCFCYVNLVLIRLGFIMNSLVRCYNDSTRLFC